MVCQIELNNISHYLDFIRYVSASRITSAGAENPEFAKHKLIELSSINKVSFSLGFHVYKTAWTNKADLYWILGGQFRTNYRAIQYIIFFVFREGLCVVKVFAIQDPSLPLQTYYKHIKEISDKLQTIPYILPFQKIIITEKAGILVRQYMKDNLYDRIRYC